MSSTNDLFEPEDFENLIAAVDSLEIPIDDDSDSSPELKSVTENSSEVDTSSSSPDSAKHFQVEGEPFTGDTSSSALESSVDDEFAELNNISNDFSELDFDEQSGSSDSFSPTVDFAAEANKATKPDAAQFSVDDPFDNAPAVNPQAAAESSNITMDDSEDDVIDVYAAFLEATEDDPQPIKDNSSVKVSKNNNSDEFSDVAGFANANSASEKVDFFGDDGFEVFDGFAAADEVANLLDEVDKASQPRQQAQRRSTATSPLQTSMQKTQAAANKLKAHLASISARKKEPDSAPASPASAVKEMPEATDTSMSLELVADKVPTETEKVSTEAKSTESPVSNATQDELNSFFNEQEQPIREPVPEQKKDGLELSMEEPSSSESFEEFNEFFEQSQEPAEIATPVNEVNPVHISLEAASEPESFEEFEEFFDAPEQQPEANVTLNSSATQPAESKIEDKHLKVGDLADSLTDLSRKSEVVDDGLMASFLESTLSSKQKVRMFSLQNFARKLPKTYLACTAILAMLGFVYILAIPVLLVISMFNGFDMLNSPFTDNMTVLLASLFGLSLFLFMAGYKLLDLKFVGPGGITLNHENATSLIDKIKQLNNEHKLPKIHDVILTRRHELNLIKIPRFGIPVWSKNVLAIGYPLLQTLPPEYFDAALTRRLLQFNKRKNLLHNWLSFMRRTWTIYAVSLKERKGVIDLFHYCFFAPYASLYRKFAVYVSQKDELLADEKALLHCNDRDLMKTAQTLRITRAMLIEYFWPKLNEELHSETAAPHYVQPYSKLPGVLKTLLNAKQVDAWFIRLGQETVNPGDPEAPFALRMETLAQRKVAVPSPFDVSAAEHYFEDRYDKMTELLNTMWAEELQKELFMENIHNGNLEADLPCHLAIEPA